jgi:hypothetical protein
METAEALVEQAVEGCTLSDFGADGWQEGLDRLVASVDADFGHDAEAVARVEQMLVARLVMRLRVEQWYAGHASEAACAVQGPVVIVGLPRTATTALQYLLASDARFRYTRPWEVGAPVPPPDMATEHEDPRRLAASSRSSVHHISSVDGPIEDGQLLGLHFHSQELGLPVPAYTRWWRTADMRSTFSYHERTLRLLHAHRPPQLWLIKGPAYLFHLESMAAQYPDARFLFTHRDPAVSMPSTCSTVEDAWTLTVPSVTLPHDVVGREMLEHYVVGMQRAMEARDALGEDSFLDVAQRDVQVDPLGTARSIYAFLDLELTDEVCAAVQQVADDNRRGSRGEHVYRTEEYGYTPDGIRDVFADYLARYGAYARPETQ